MTKKQSFLPSLFILGISIVLYQFSNQILSYNNFSLEVVIPYLLLLTPYREITVEAWKKYAPINTKIIRNATPVPEILAQDYSYEALREASSNFRLPVIVSVYDPVNRGMFNGTKGIQYWGQKDYLSTKLGDTIIPIVKNGVIGTLQNDRELVSFRESFDRLYNSTHTREYLFFPVLSRFAFNGSEEGSATLLKQKVNDLCREDLEFDRIWKGFGTKRHTTYAGSQLIIGKSPVVYTPSETTGSDWHCANGNNWFIQVVGTKRWHWVEPKYSPYLSPLKGGFANMWTGDKNLSTLEKHIPRYESDLHAGDMLYNPHWMWHKIKNYGGLTIGIPVRETNVSLGFQNNFYFTTIILTNLLLSKIGLPLGGYPPPSLATEQDN